MFQKLPQIRFKEVTNSLRLLRIETKKYYVLLRKEQKHLDSFLEYVESTGKQVSQEYKEKRINEYTTKIKEYTDIINENKKQIRMFQFELNQR